MTSDGTGTADGATATGPGESGEEPCPEDTYCYERFDFREIHGPQLLRSVDVDGDGRPDLAFGHVGEVGEFSVLRWEEGPSFIQAPDSPRTGHPLAPARLVDGEPLQFVFARGSKSELLRIAVVGERIVEAVDALIDFPEYSGGPSRFESLDAVFDLDGDGLEREAIMHGGDGDSARPFYRPHLMQWSGGVWAPHSLPFPLLRSLRVDTPPVAVADLDSDGRVELVLVDDLLDDYDPTSGSSYPTDYEADLHHVVALRVTETGFEETWRAPSAVAVHWIGVGDLDGDGVPDLVLSGWTGIAVAKGTGGGRFTEPVRLDLSPHVDLGRGPDHAEVLLTTTIGDLDGNGRSEVVAIVGPWVSDEGFEVITVHDPFGAGEVRTVISNLDVSRSSAVPLAVLDLDGNGRGDIAFQAHDEDQTFLAVLMSMP